MSGNSAAGCRDRHRPGSPPGMETGKEDKREVRGKNKHLEETKPSTCLQVNDRKSNGCVIIQIYSQGSRVFVKALKAKTSSFKLFWENKYVFGLLTGQVKRSDRV